MSNEVIPGASDRYKADPPLNKAAWMAKFAVCALYDLFDMTVGRVLFATPFVGEAVGIGLTCVLFGKAGMLYGLEALDFTEQVDGFVPAASIIAWANRVK